MPFPSAPHDIESPAAPQNRLLRGSAWLISAAVHLVGLLILSLIVIALEAPEPESVITARQERQKPPYDPQIRRDIQKTLKIEHEKMVESPVHPTDVEVTITETPQGTSLDNQSNKNLNHSQAIDAAGIGGGPAGAYGDRMGRPGLKDFGGGPEGEDAMDAALRWLDRHQVKSGADAGRWGAADWPEECQDGGCRGPSFAEPGFYGPGRGSAHYDVGVSSLALLAFLGAGHSHKQGDFKRTVRLGLQWIIKNQDRETGAIGLQADHGESMYNHALATMALAEACIIENDPKLFEPTEMAVAFCLVSQNDGSGWKYGVKPGRSDTSVTGWMIFALKAAKTAGFQVPDSAFEGAGRFLDRATAATGEVGYHGPGGGSSYLPALKEKLGADMHDPVPCMTAVAVISRVFLGQDLKSAPIAQGAAIVLKTPPEPWSSAKPGSHKTANFYYWYYGTYAIFQVYGKSPEWRRWNEAMLGALVPTQRRAADGDPDADGSWDPIGEWAFVGGRVYSTAINALTLQVYYRYRRQVGESP